MNHLLSRLLVQPFYRRHVLLFALLVLVAFGAVRADSLVRYHRALLEMQLHYPLALAALLLAWAAYFGRIASTGLRLLRSAEGNFLYQLRCWPGRRQLWLLAGPCLQMAAPVWAYLLLLAAYALHQAAWGAATVVLLFAGAAPLLVLRSWSRALNHIGTGSHDRVPRARRPRPFFTWPLLHLLQSAPRNTLLAKGTSFLLLYIPLVWNADRFDHDSLPLFLVALVAANSPFAWWVTTFLEGDLRGYRALPLRGSRIATLLLGTFGLLLLPEAVYLFVAGHTLIRPTELALIALAPPLTLWLLAAVWYGSQDGRNDVLKVLGGLSFVSLFFFNSGAFGWWDALLLLAGLVLFAANYRQHEA